MAANPFDACASESGVAVSRVARRGYSAASLGAEEPPSRFLEEAHTAFREFVTRQDFPCVGARAAFNSGSYEVAVYDEFASEHATAALARDLFAFTRSDIRETSEYATFVAVFSGPGGLDEMQFERLLWQQLTLLNRADAPHFGWDPMAQPDPADPQFSFSFGGQALYVIGLHPNSSREARRFPQPALVFNPHEQFERLRADGKWKRMQQTIRERDIQLQGSINPMLSDFGEATEARQYSGRAVEDDWQAPFKAASRPQTGKCPFGH